MKNNNNHPYYNRPSLTTSFQIAAISILCLVIMVLGLIVSEVVNDFTNNSIYEKKETIGEISYQMETIDERMLKRIKSRRMNKRIYRYIDIKI